MMFFLPSNHCDLVGKRNRFDKIPYFENAFQSSDSIYFFDLPIQALAAEVQ